MIVNRICLLALLPEQLDCLFCNFICPGRLSQEDVSGDVPAMLSHPTLPDSQEGDSFESIHLSSGLC